jgi:Calcineurin-like phosphoesterase
MQTRFAIAFLTASVWLASGCGASVAKDVQTTPVEVTSPKASDAPVALPNDKESLHFAVLGDFGTGEQPSRELAQQFVKFYQQFKYDLVITVGDNLYGAERPQDFKRKFEEPYKPLLDEGIKFHASLGNHDSREQRYYKLFNLDGKLYYSFKAPKEKVRFFVLDSTYPVPEQIEWLEKELKGSNEPWKIAYFHHPLYSSADRHGSDVKLRQVVEPLFIQYNVSVVFNGHDHVYERIKPQNGIAYFIVGAGGALRPGNLERNSDLTAKGYDLDRSFLVAEIQGDRMYFQAVTRTGKIIDSGIVERRKTPE